MSATLEIQNKMMVANLGQTIEEHLAQEKQRIFDEILNYPPPIPACDVQFNFLLAKRAEITQALRQFGEIMNAEWNLPVQAQAVREFIETCKFFDDALQASLLAALDGVLNEQHSF